MNKKFKILLVEDDSIEIMKMRRVMDSLNLPHEIIEVGNGAEALEMLKKPHFSPNLILVDLHMPIMNGFDLLKKLKTIEEVKIIPTVVLTTSKNNQDISNCYKLGVSRYITKTHKYIDYLEKMRNLFNYLNSNELAMVS